MPVANVSLVTLGRVRACEARKAELFNYALEGRAKRLHVLLEGTNKIFLFLSLGHKHNVGTIAVYF